MSRSGWKAPALLGILGAIAAGCGGSEFTGTDATTAGGATGPGGAGGGTGGGSATVGTTTSGPGGAGPGGSGTGGAPCVDADGDGTTGCAGDCDDADVTVAPTAPEICGDAKDNDCANGVDDPCGGLGTYVSNAGNDLDPGTQEKPVATIKQGIANAVQIGNGVDVYVAAGHYPEKVVMVEGVSLLGGYKEDAAGWIRDIAANDTAILCPDFQCVVIGQGVTRQTLLEGFRIEGLKGTPVAPPGSAAVVVLGGSPTITQNAINGGEVSGAQWPSHASVGVEVVSPTAAPGPLISGNVIEGGKSNGTSYAVLLDSAGVWPPPGPTVAEIAGNELRGGDAPTTAGLASWTSGPGTLIQDNDLFGGDSTPGGGSWGIEIQGEAVINQNRVNVGANGIGVCAPSSTWCGGIVSYSATATITNNVVFGPTGIRTTAVFLLEAEGPAGAVILNGNYLEGGGNQGNSGQSQSSAIVLRNAYMGTNTVVGRIRNNILRAGTNAARYGVFEELTPGKTARPELLHNNDFALTPAATEVLYRQYDGASPMLVNTLAGVNMLPFASANILGDPVVDATFHLTAQSPCIDKGIAVEAPATDFDGEARPLGAGVDIGADEAM